MIERFKTLGAPIDGGRLSPVIYIYIYIYVNFKAINNVLDAKMYIMYIWSHPRWLLFTVIYESTQFSIQIDQLKVQCICLLTQDI